MIKNIKRKGLYVGVLLAISPIAPAATASDECVIDQVMKEHYITANKRSQTIIESSMQNRDVREEACLPAWESLSGSIRNGLPSFSNLSDLGRSLATKIRDMSCNYANTMIEKTAKQANLGYEAPYGLMSIEVGLSTGGSAAGVYNDSQSRTEELLKETVDQRLRAAGRAATNVATGAVDNATSNITGVNRSGADSYTQDLRDAGRDIDKQINDKARNALNNF